MKVYTDYLFVCLGDLLGQNPPVREVEVISYDGDKYCLVKVDNIVTEIKAGYLYTKSGVFGQVPTINPSSLPRTVRRTST